MKACFCLGAILLLAMPSVFVAEPPQRWLSPNQELAAIAITRLSPDKPERLDLSWQDVLFKDTKGNPLALLTLETGTGVGPGSILNATWSPDSRFFAFKIASSGGHSAWHSPAYVFDASDSRVYSVDATMGPVATSDSKLHISHSNTVTIDFYDYKAAWNSDSFLIPRTLSLPEFVKTAKIAPHLLLYATGGR
jgi:hypothetical protein